MKRFFYLLRLFPRASRMPFLSGSLISVGLGTALAYNEHGFFDPARFALTLLGMAGAHLAVNIFNDYFDYRYGADTAHPPRPLSGGSQVIQEGLETADEYLAQALICSGVAVAAALILARLAGPLVLYFACLGGLLGYFYSARPLLLSWRGLGEVTTGFCFGPLVVAGTFYVQTGFITPACLVLSLVPGALITMLLFINQYPDYHDDLRAGKKTLVVRLGRRRSLPLLYLFLAAAFVPLLPGPWLPIAPLPGGAVMAGLIPAAAAAGRLSASGGKPDPQNKPGKLMLLSYTLTISLYVLGICFLY
ncbi:MAG: prenyltransferase [Bacillota bacterium]